MSKLVAECLPEKVFANELNPEKYGDQAYYRQGYSEAVDQIRTALRSKGFDV